MNPGPLGCQPSCLSRAYGSGSRGYHKLTTRPSAERMVDGINLIITRELLDRFVNWLRRRRRLASLLSGSMCIICLG